MNTEPRTNTGRLLVASGLSFRSGRWLRDSPELVAQIEEEAVARYNAEADDLLADPVIDARIKAYFAEKDATTRAEAVAAYRAELAAKVRIARLPVDVIAEGSLLRLNAESVRAAMLRLIEAES